MEQSVIVSGNDSLREIRDGKAARAIRLEGSGALCAGTGGLFCACGEMIWRLNAERLVPTGLFAGGPGMSALCLSPCGRHVYALCSDADSLLMLDARSGTPEIVCRAGVNPPCFAMERESGVLAVAGGGSGETLLLDAETLGLMRALPMPCAACGVAIGGGCVHTLCMTETLDSLLVTIARTGEGNRLPLAGSPGALLLADGMLLAATHGFLYAMTPDGGRILRCWEAPGRAGKLLVQGCEVLLVDSLGETLTALRPKDGRWRCAMPMARDAVHME